MESRAVVAAEDERIFSLSVWWSDEAGDAAGWWGELADEDTGATRNFTEWDELVCLLQALLSKR